MGVLTKKEIGNSRINKQVKCAAQILPNLRLERASETKFRAASPKDLHKLILLSAVITLLFTVKIAADGPNLVKLPFFYKRIILQ